MTIGERHNEGFDMPWERAGLCAARRPIEPNKPLFLRLFDSEIIMNNGEVGPDLKPLARMAGAVGFEPTDAGIKTRCLNHLATPQHASFRYILYSDLTSKA